MWVIRARVYHEKLFNVSFNRFVYTLLASKQRYLVLTWYALLDVGMGVADIVRIVSDGGNSAERKSPQLLSAPLTFREVSLDKRSYLASLSCEQRQLTKMLEHGKNS